MPAKIKHQRRDPTIKGIMRNINPPLTPTIKLFKHRPSKQKGQVLVLFALFMVAIVGVMGLALDAGIGYLSQTGMQSASDNASLAASRMVAADYRALGLNPTGSPPFSYSNVVQAVNAIIGQNQAGTSSVSSYSAYFTTITGASICQFWPDTAPTNTSPNYCPNMFPATEGLPFDANANLMADGAKVVSLNAHPVYFTDIFGGNSAQVKVSATSVYGVVYQSSTANIGYAVYGVDCATNGPLTVGETITYYSPDWSKAWPCANLGDSNFKGDLNNVTPNPITSPGWAEVNSGSGSLSLQQEQISAGQTVLMPVIDCLAHNPSTGSFTSPPCTEPPGDAYCTDLPYANLPLTGTDGMCVIGLIAVKALTACTNASSPCTGVIVPYSSNQAGIFVCTITSSPNCPALNQTSGGGQAIAIRLYK